MRRSGTKMNLKKENNKDKLDSDSVGFGHLTKPANILPIKSRKLNAKNTPTGRKYTFHVSDL